MCGNPSRSSCSRCELLFVTNTPSCGATRKVCCDRAFAWRNVTSFDVDSQRYDPEWDGGKCCLGTLSGSPLQLHFQCGASPCPMMSFVLLHSRQLFCPSVAGVTCLIVVVGSLGLNCAQSETAFMILDLVNLLATFGLSMIGTNLLCHRCLVEKARVMIKQTARQSWTALPHFISTPLPAT